MNLEESVKDIIQSKLSDGTIEKIISEKLEKGVNDAMNELFSCYGDVGKLIKNKTKEVLIPAIESYDFSDSVVKLDVVLSEILKQTALTDNKKILENFKELMIEPEYKEIKLSELFEIYCNYVRENVNTSELEINDEDGYPRYKDVICLAYVERQDRKSWSSFEYATLTFECDEDEDMNFTIMIDRWCDYDGDKWNIDIKIHEDMKALRLMNSFELMLLKLSRSNCKLILDSEECEDYITPEAEPEATYR